MLATASAQVCVPLGHSSLYCLSVFCRLAILVRLSVPEQVIDWKDSSPKWPVMCWWRRKPYSLTHWCNDNYTVVLIISTIRHLWRPFDCHFTAIRRYCTACNEGCYSSRWQYSFSSNIF